MPVTFFASGSNHSGEIAALNLIDGGNIGTVAKRLTGSATYDAAMRELSKFEGLVFIDSGAFEEVKFPGGVPTIVKPLGNKHWDMVFDVYAKVARMHQGRAFLVAPDCIAHQELSLQRLAKYSERCIDLWEEGANVLVPLQKGALSLAEYEAQAKEILDGISFIPSIPMKKDATSLEELMDFVRTRRPSHIHLLGCAPDSKAGKAAIAAVLAELPHCEVFCDACLLGRWTPKSGGKYPGKLRKMAYLQQMHLAKLAECEDGRELEGHNEVHVRKLLNFWMAARQFWTRLDIRHASGVGHDKGLYEELMLRAQAPNKAVFHLI